MTSSFIHPTALVESGAQIGDDVYIGPFCTVGPQVKIGAGSRLQSHVVVEGDTTIGEKNIFSPFCTIGSPPQDLGYKNEPTRVVIGHRNIFREGFSVHRGTPKDKTVTTIGDDNYIMGYCHVAHDCVVGHHVIMANQTALAGHVNIGNFVTIGGQSAIVQKVRIGDYCFIGAGTIVRKDIPPYMCAKEFSQITSPNLVGLKRSGMNEENVRVACELYKMLYLSPATTEKNIREIEERYAQNALAKVFVDFVRASKVGIQR